MVKTVVTRISRAIKKKKVPRGRREGGNGASMAEKDSAHVFGQMMTVHLSQSRFLFVVRIERERGWVFCRKWRATMSFTKAICPFFRYISSRDLPLLLPFHHYPQLQVLHTPFFFFKFSFHNNCLPKRWRDQNCWIAVLPGYHLRETKLIRFKENFKY